MYCAEAEKMNKTSGGMFARGVEALFSERGIPSRGAVEPLNRKDQGLSCRFPETAAEIAAIRPPESP